MPGQYLSWAQKQAYTQAGNRRVGLADRIGGFHSEAGLNALLIINLAIRAGLSRWVTFGQLQKQDLRCPPNGLSLIHFSKS
ncbi:MAG: hypothetical protein C0407_06595 [Desulfobacca sp.]|nr:hypothetical protein [Desulfobacca sp.]